MRLPDFNQHEGMLCLRRQMNARRPGHFVLFDASKHLTGQERSRLENQGVKTSFDSLRVLPDQTLAIKNGRVLVFFLSEDPVLTAHDRYGVSHHGSEMRVRAPETQENLPSQRAKAFFHVAACKNLQQRHTAPLVATTRLTSPFPVPGATSGHRSLSVCPDCLTLLAFKGFSLTRNRKIRYSEQLLRHFQLQDFFRVYTLYPVRLEGLSSLSVSSHSKPL